MARGFKLVDLVGAKVYSEGGREPIGRIVALGVDGEFVRVTVAGLSQIDPPKGSGPAPTGMKPKPAPVKRRGFFD